MRGREKSLESLRARDRYRSPTHDVADSRWQQNATAWLYKINNNIYASLNGERFPLGKAPTKLFANCSRPLYELFNPKAKRFLSRVDTLFPVRAGLLRLEPTVNNPLTKLSIV
jgi:hypothetical protein